MPERIAFREHSPLRVDDGTVRRRIIDGTESLRGVLRPTIRQISVEGPDVRLQNLVGSFRIADGSIVEVAPKVEAGTWSAAVVQLLESDTRIAITGSQRSMPSARRDDLTSALAHEFARRLGAALRSEGPIQVYERQHLVTPRLRGRLDVGRWLRTSVIDPTRFPVSRDELTSLNDFSRGLSLVAGMLGRAASGPELAARLRLLQTVLVPGQAVPTYVNPAVARRAIPAQWAKYRPAWDIAAPLLRNRSVVGDPGRASGLEVAIEPWRLLETLLVRALGRLEVEHGEYALVPKARHPLLVRNTLAAVRVEPDGMMMRDGRVAATFECKYTVPGPTPDESHVYQALATAAALESPLSVLIYPGAEPQRAYDIIGFHGHPKTLVTIGLNLYAYERGVGDLKRAETLHRVLEDPHSSAAL